MASLISQKMEGFCISIISGMGQSDAYREHYNCSKMKPESIHRKAKELIDNVKIAARLENHVPEKVTA